MAAMAVFCRRSSSALFLSAFHSDPDLPPSAPVSRKDPTSLASGRFPLHLSDFRSITHTSSRISVAAGEARKQFRGCDLVLTADFGRCKPWVCSVKIAEESPKVRGKISAYLSVRAEDYKEVTLIETEIGDDLREVSPLGVKEVENFWAEGKAEEFDKVGGGSGGSGGDSGGDKGGGGGGSGDEENSDEQKGKSRMSMSQKLTLAYAGLVGVGGLIGYFKSGSTNSLVSGLGSAAALFYVYTQLPHNPQFASSIGLGVSALLLVVMGSRFRNSGKIFPAGVVSLFSFIMTAGYLHGIVRSSHS